MSSLFSTAASPSLRCLPPRIRVRLLPQRQPDRHPRQGERLAQRIDQIALVAVRHGVGAGAEQNEARRAAFRLGNVVELEPAARYGGGGGGGGPPPKPHGVRTSRGWRVFPCGGVSGPAPPREP